MKILFICHANLCRSVLAQELLKKYVPQATVFSRGLYAALQKETPALVLEYLASKGIENVPHQPTQFNPAELEDVDFAFCMEPQQRDRLLDQYAQYTDKIWLLDEYVYGTESAVPDPMGLDKAAFFKIAAQLDRTILQCAHKLTA